MIKEDAASQGHQSNAHISCVSLVPIFNHLEEEQMNEITKTIYSVKY